MKRKIICAAMSAFMITEIFYTTALADITDITAIYVSKDGSKRADGSISNPFESIEQAREKIKNLKSNGGIGKDGAVVYIRGGKYSFKESITFTEEDSGKEEAPITYCAYPGEKVEFIGGISIKASDFKTITDEDVIRKITYPGLKEKIKYIDLKNYDIQEIPNAPLYGSYSYMVTEPLGGPKEETPFEIFMGNEVMTVAKYPNGDEQMTADEIVELGTNGFKFSDYARGNGAGFDEDAPEWKNYKCLTIKMNQLERLQYWGEAKHAIMNSILSYDWARQSMPIEKIDTSTGTITTAYPAVFTSKAGRAWNIYNLLEELDSPGEYYIDKDSGKLYVYLSDEIYRKDEDVKMSVLNTPLLNFKGASYINIKNIEISEVRSQAINVSGGNNINIFGCEIYNIPTHSVNLNNSPYSGLDNCYIHDVDLGMFIIGGDYETLTDSNMYVTNCEFENFSRLNGTDRPAISFQGVGHKITHNKIHGSVHQAVWFMGNNNDFSYNEIYDVATHSADTGAIYGLRKLTCFGNQWKYNYIHDIGEFATADGALGSNGIYFDDGMAGGYVAGNVFENINGAGVFGAGRDLNITNNIFINCSYAAAAFSKRTIFPDSGVGIEMMNALKNMLPWWKDGPNEIWKKAYPEQLDNLLESMNGDGYQQKNEMTNNIVINSKEVNDDTSTGAKVENNYVTTRDPGFYDFKGRNYTLKKDAKVYNELPDFQFIPFTRIGKVDERAEQRAAKAIILAVDSNEALVKGKKVKIDNENREIAPKIKNSKAYVPIRFIAEAFNVAVDWNSESKTAYIDDGRITLNSISGEILKDGVKADQEEKIFSENGRIYVPLRTVSELLDYKVFWDDKGFISISNVENLFNPDNDSDLISYLYNGIAVHYK